MSLTKSRKRLCTMSTERSKKKRRFAGFERIKIIEYGCIALVILLFLGLAIYYGNKPRSNRDSVESDLPSPVPTEDASIRGMNVLNALEKNGFSVTYRSDSYDVVSPKGIPFTLRMLSDDRGIRELSATTLLCADPKEDTLTAQTLRAENRATVEAIRALFDCIMPVFHRTISDSDTITKQCQNVVKDGSAYSKHFGNYSVRIISDPDETPQSVTVFLIRDD